MKAHVVYGPPGCGKTTEMLRRVEVAKQSFETKEIGFLSFTKAGAAEALKRLGITRSDKICTIHSLMYRLGNFDASSIIDWRKLKAFGDKAGFKFRGQANDTGEQMEMGDQYLSILQRAENRCVPLQDEYYESDRPGDWESFRFFCESYGNWKTANGYADFNDMLKSYVLHPRDPHIKWLGVDEAQDLSELQWQVIRAILKYGVNECHVAGDDDQAIYEWSGAHTHGMVEFEDTFQAEQTVLTQSWRVPAKVHALATTVTNRIVTRVQKDYLPREEAGRLSRSSSFDHKAITPGQDTLILCRNHMTKKEIEDELIRYRVPYKSEGGLPGLFANRVADAIRVFKRLEKGEAIGAQALDLLMMVADDRTKKELQTKTFGPLLKRGYIRSFIINPRLVDFYREADMEAEPTVRISTIHAAKGREADKVILHTGLTDKTHRDMAKGDTQADAEARVWYVGVTRAKHHLEILEGDNGYDL